MRTERIFIGASSSTDIGGLCRGSKGHSMREYLIELYKSKVQHIGVWLSPEGNLYVEECYIINAQGVTKETLKLNFPEEKEFFKGIIKGTISQKELTEQNVFSIMIDFITYKDSKHKLRVDFEECGGTFKLDWNNMVVSHLDVEGDIL